MLVTASKTVLACPRCGEVKPELRTPCSDSETCCQCCKEEVEKSGAPPKCEYDEAVRRLMNQ